MGVTTVGLIGCKGGIMKKVTDYSLDVSADTVSIYSGNAHYYRSPDLDLIEKKFYG